MEDVLWGFDAPVAVRIVDGFVQVAPRGIVGHIEPFPGRHAMNAESGGNSDTLSVNGLKEFGDGGGYPLKIVIEIPVCLFDPPRIQDGQSGMEDRADVLQAW